LYYTKHNGDEQPKEHKRGFFSLMKSKLSFPCV